MGKRIITINIDGPEVEAGKFLEAVESFYEIVRSVTNEITGTRNAARWRVSVQSGSNLVNLEPLAEEASDAVIDSALDTVLNELSMIENPVDREIPEHFNYPNLRKLKKVASIGVPTNGIDTVEISTNGRRQALSENTVTKVDSFLSKTYEDYGSIEGRLQTLSGRGGLKLTVYDSYGRAIVGYFKSEAVREKYESAVIDAFGDRIALYGLIRYQADGKPTSIKFEEVEVFPKGDDLPSPKDVKGILARTNG